MMMSQILINELPQFIPKNITLNIDYIEIITYEKFNTHLNFFNIKIVDTERYSDMINAIKLIDIRILDLRYKKEFNENITITFNNKREILIATLCFIYIIIEYFG